MRINHPVAIQIGAEQQLRRHTPDQQQLLDRIERPVLGVSTAA